MTPLSVTISYPSLKQRLETDDICFKYLESVNKHLNPLKKQLLKYALEGKHRLCGDTAHSIKGMLSYLDILSLEVLLIQLEKLSYQSSFHQENFVKLIATISLYLEQVIHQVRKLLKRSTEPR